MTDILIPPWLNISRVAYSPVENVGVSPSPFGGFPRTATLSAGRMRATMEFTAQGGASTQSERGSLIATLVRAGKQNRVVFGNPGFRLRGSWPGGELLSNNTFASGTAGWSTLGPAFTVSERFARLTRVQYTAGTDVLAHAQLTGLTQYAPYAARCFDIEGRGAFISGVQLGSFPGLSDYASSAVAGGGMKTAVGVVPATTADFSLVDASTVNIAGDYYEVAYTSTARCALVDGGANLLLHSDDFSNAAWAKTNCTVGANAIAAPDGTATADSLIDDATAASHFLSQSVTVTSAVQDVQLTCAVKAGSRNFAALSMNTASGGASGFIDLTTGAISGLAVAVSFADVRGFATSLGGGWWRFSIVARKTTSETSISERVFSANTGTSTNYSGAGNAAIYAWRGTASVSGAAARLPSAATTTSATSGETQLANGLHLKGLPASANGLLLPGDEVEVITSSRGGEFKIVTAPLNSDASGLGYLQFAPALKFSPGDNAGVIIQSPMGRFISLTDAESWNTDPGIITTASGEFIEA